MEQIPEKIEKQEEIENQSEKIEEKEIQNEKVEEKEIQNELSDEELTIEEGLKKYSRGAPSLEQQKQDAARRKALETLKERQPSKNSKYVMGKNANPIKVEKGREPADD